MASKAPDLEGDIVMRVHHLNTGTMCPIGRRLVNGTGSIFQRARMVCHCLLIETDDGLVGWGESVPVSLLGDPRRMQAEIVGRLAPALIIRSLPEKKTLFVTTEPEPSVGEFAPPAPGIEMFWPGLGRSPLTQFAAVA